MVRVTSKYGESIERLIQRFKRACNKEGILKELKRRESYEKPSERRRRKFKERLKNMQKAQEERGEKQVPIQPQPNP
jgi:small subunit ribosomal protein S21